MSSPKPVLLCILDGFGIAEDSEHNAVSLAKPKFWQECLKKYPNSKIITSGFDVGLPAFQIGNSEVGHMSIGAGRIIKQDLVKINEAIADDSLKNKPSLKFLVSKLKENNKSCHLIGLASDGGVHCHIDHIIYLSKFLGSTGIKLHLHLFLDGRDSNIYSSIKFIEQIQYQLREYENVNIASICGRFFGMDRDNRWDRTEKAYKAIVESEAMVCNDFISYLKDEHKKNISDEFIEPVIFSDYNGFKDLDAVVICNYRSDRIRQLAFSLTKNFTHFKRKKVPDFSATVSMTEYSEDLKDFLEPIFINEPISDSLSEIISKKGLTQLKIAETEKYAHVTFFFNAGIEKPYEKEDRILIASPKVKTYDLCPEMSAYELTEVLVNKIKNNNYYFILANYANADMIGHTGNLEAGIKTVKVLDECLEKIVNAIKEVDGVAVITSDHGNIEHMYDTMNKCEHTSHTDNLVPLVIISNNKKYINIGLNNGRLSDISPTILDIMEISKPKQMTGSSLIIKKKNNDQKSN